MTMTPEERLSAWLDGELSPQEAAAFERELTDNPALAERAADWRASDKQLAGAFAPLGSALAASLALITFLGWRQSAPQPDPLSLALDTTPAMQSARLANGSTIEPVLTVRARDGRWCREYRSGPATALACRGSQGRWTVEASDSGAPTGDAPAADGYALAAGSQSTVLDSAYARLGAADPIGAGEETSLINGKWGDR